MTKANKLNVVSWVLLGLIALAFFFNIGILIFAMPKTIALFRDYALQMPGSTLFVVWSSDLITNPINDILLAPILLVSAVGLVLKEILVKRQRYVSSSTWACCCCCWHC